MWLDMAAKVFKIFHNIYIIFQNAEMKEVFQDETEISYIHFVLLV